VKSIERTLLRRPRILNAPHRFHLVKPLSQTNSQELAVLTRRAAGKQKALEIGTFQGVSAARIAGAIVGNGLLYCVDPWPDVAGRPNPCWHITQRHLKRTKTLGRITFIRGLSADVQHLIPNGLDFVFIDGDHSWQGIEVDWSIVATRVVPNGIVCMHDVVTPPEQPWRTLDSVRFFQNVVLNDQRFKLVEVTHSMAVLKRL
jgi:predicted O-methyltransferase YrrM